MGAVAAAPFTRPIAIGRPSELHELLLRAALLEGEEAARAYREWRDRVGVSRIDPAQQRLLPRLYVNLRDRVGDEPEPGALKRRYIDTWVRNRKLCAAVIPVLRALRESGTESLILKGPVLAELHYRDWGQRPMVDVDLLVRRESSDTAVSVLSTCGFERIVSSLRAPFRTLHACGFRNAAGQEIDLHTSLLLQCCWRGSDSEIWSGTRTLEIAGEPVRALSPTDQLLHVCVHGVFASVYDNVDPNIQWVADAMAILERESGAIDWERLTRAAQGRGLTLALASALRYLREGFHAPVPRATLAALDATPPTLTERIEVLTSRVRKREALSLLNSFTRYLRIRRDPEYSNPVSGLARFLLDIWALDHVGQLPRVFAGKCARVAKSLLKR